LLIRKIVGYWKQTLSGDNRIVGPVATFPINNRDPLSRDRTVYLRTENIYDPNPFKSDGRWKIGLNTCIESSHKQQVRLANHVFGVNSTLPPLCAALAIASPTWSKP
jgi:hypothetical protein